MPNGGKGAIAKIYVETEVIDNFKQQAAKIKSGLGNGLKDLKDLDLKFGFDEKSMAEATSKELDAMMNTMTSKKLNKLDFSGIVPNMVSFLNDDSIADTVKLQIVQGLRLGLESFSSTASSIDIKTLMRGDGNTVFSNILGYTSIQDILKSFDFTKQKSNLLNKQFNTTMGLSVGKDKEGFAKDVAQLLSLKATYDNPKYQGVSQYLISGTYRKGDKDVSMFKLQTLSELLDPYVMQKRGEEGTLTPKVVEDIAGYLERMKYLGEVIQLNAGEGAPTNALLDQYNSIVGDKNYSKFIEYIGNDPKLSAIFNTTRERVAEASRYKDVQYAQIDWRSFATDINDALARLIMGAGNNGAMGRLLPIIQGWESDQKQFTADELLSETIRSISVESEDNGLRQDNDYAERAEKAAGRAEKAANKAEAARDKAQEIVNNISDKLEEIGDANPNDQNSASASQGQDESGSPDDKPSTEGAATRAEGVAEEGEAIVEGLQHEEEALNEAAKEIHEERERVEQARENFDEEVNNSKQGKTQSSTSATTSQSDTAPQEGREQVKPEVEVAEKETGEVRKSREDLEKERQKLEAEIQNSTQLMNGAERQIADIDQKIGQTQNNQQRNEANISQLTEKKERIESQIQQTKDELKTIKERLQDAVDAKQAAEDEIKILEEQLLNADDSGIISADTSENANKYNELKEQKDYLVFEQETFNRPVLDDLTKKKQSIEDILNQDYSVKTIDEAYKQAMQRKKEYLEKTKKYAKAIEETEKYETGSAEWVMKIADAHSISAEQDAAWMAYYKSMQEFESHGKESNSKITKRKRLYSGIPSMEMPTDENAEVFLSNLQEYLDHLREQIAGKEEEIKTTQEELDRLQQKMDELSSHLVTTDNVSEQLEKKKQEQQKYKQEEDDWTTQQANKQTELDNLDEQLNGTKGAANHLKAAQDSHQNNQEELAQLQHQRAEQQRIYDEAKAIQEEKTRQLEELNQLIAETEARESAPPSIPATGENNGGNGTTPPSEHGGEESPVVQNVNQQLENLKNEEQQLKDKLAQITDEKQNTKKIVDDINNVLNKDVSVKTAREAYNNAQLALINASTRAAERFDDRAPRDKNSNEWKEWLERNKEIIQQEKIAWIEYYKAMEEFESHGGETTSKIANRRRLQPSNAVKHTREDWGFTTSEDLKQQLQADLQAKKELLASYKQQEEELNSQIAIVQQKKEQVKTQPPLSSSGSQTADGVQEEGNEADDAASKMKALADAKKEALEANQQLAESADTTTKAIQDESSAGDFNTLILALTEIYELLSQLPQSFEGVKGFDLTGFTEPLNSLSQVIQQLPKEGFNISLGDSFDNLANRIDEVLQKIQELTSQAKTAEIESSIAEEYDGQIKQLNEQINQLRADAEEAKKALEELKKTQQDAEQITPITKEKKQTDPLSQIDKQLVKEYDNLHHAQDKLFTTTNVSEYNSALENVENTLQRIRQLEQDIVSQYAGQSQTDYLLMGYGDDPIDTLSNRLPESTKARNEAQSSTRQLAKEYIEQQKAEIETLVDSLKTINIIPEDTQSNWGKKCKEEYAQITEGAQAASQAIDILNASLESMETSGANPAILKNFLELKESTAQMVKDVQDKNNVFGDNVETASTKLLERLSNVEERLQVIKRDSGKLINIDPALAGALTTIEKHLNKIHDLKNTVSKDPLQAINPQFTRSTNSYLAQMEGKGKSKSVVEGLEQTSARSQADFKRMTTNYGSYATALKKLFDDMSKGAGVSLKQLEEDLKRVNELATKLANSTGLERDNLLTGELNPKADPKVADAQAGAANKVAIAYESMFTKIESEARTAQSTIEGIFGTEGIAQGLDARFVEGNVEGFNDFVQNANQAGEALKRLKEIQENIGNDKNWATQEENVKEYQQTVETLNESLKQVAENASKFSVTDELDVQKLRASTTQFIKDNPALSGGDVSQLEGFIDQLQGKINSVDFTAIKNGIESVKQTAIEAGRTGDTFFSLLTQRFKSLGAYLLSFASFYEVIGVFKQGINIVHELDDALTEMQKVSDESLSSLREYQKGTFDTADKIGTTAAQLQQSTADWMRLGEDLQTASQSAQTANVLFNVSEFDNINDATTALVAMSAAYADAEKGIEKMDIVDRLNLIGNNYAIATDELATALQDGAATLQTAGNDLDQAIALTTAGNIKIA